MIEKLEESVISLADPLLPRRESVRMITFYSFKGGVGRTMALANVAYRLAHQHDLRVIAVDWDLEAPGLPPFFGITREELAGTPGVLDFMIEWRDGVETKSSDPPESRKCLIPVTRPPYGPEHGSLSIMTAGKQDGHYDERLASLDWRMFYKDRSGAMAVERLRRLLLEEADVVLVDSRTGLTDPGGICTVQLPDGVILMAAPNEQSLSGIEGAAVAIRDRGTKRAGRHPPRVWVSLCRVPYLEEQPLTEGWIEEHRPWFEAGIERGLWARADHPRGLRSHMLVHRARWGLGEQLLHKSNGFGSDDPLAKAFDALAETMLFDKPDEPENEPRSEDEPRIEVSDRSPPNEKAFKERVRLAERRRDMAVLSMTLYEFGKLLHQEHRFDEARAVLERAAGIFLAARNDKAYGQTQVMLGYVHLEQRRFDVAKNVGERALTISREVSDEFDEAAAIHLLATIAQEQQDFSSAETWYRKALRILEEQGNEHSAAITYNQLGRIARKQGDLASAERWHRNALAILEKQGNEHGTAHSYHQLGRIAQEQGNSASADAWYRKALAIFEKLGEEQGAVATYGCLAIIAHARGDLPDAEDWYRKSLLIMERLSDERGTGYIYIQLGHLASLLRHFEEAGQWLMKSATAFKRSNDSRRLQQAEANFRGAYRKAPPAEQAKLQTLWEAAGLGKLPAPVETR